LAVLVHLLDMTGPTREVAMSTSLIQLAAAGDTVAFARLVAAYHRDMIRVAFVVCGGSQDLADDAVQAAWTIAWRKLGSVRDPDRVKPWLVSVAANEARQLWRREHRRYVAETDVAAYDETSDSARFDPTEEASGIDLRRALRHLSANDRALLALHYEAGLDSFEIGELYGRPASTIRWQLSRLLARLRKELADA
jgi:RNA polymerase sigma-70 factor (ECF subfamily)